MPRKRASGDRAIPIIAKNLAAVRADLKLSQGDAADRAGLPQAQLSRWERGHQKPEIDALLKLAVAYQCSIEDFVAGVSEAYDELTERGIGVNVRRHYQARYAELRRLALQAVESITSVVETAPTTGGSAEGSEKGRGKSKAVRARRKFR